MQRRWFRHDTDAMDLPGKMGRVHQGVGLALQPAHHALNALSLHSFLQDEGFTDRTIREHATLRSHKSILRVGPSFWFWDQKCTSKLLSDAFYVIFVESRSYAGRRELGPGVDRCDCFVHGRNSKQEFLKMSSHITRPAAQDLFARHGGLGRGRIFNCDSVV